MKVVLFVSLSLFPSVAIAQEEQDPIPANRITPAMISRFEYEYPQAAVDCLKTSLETIEGNGREYLFTSDYQRGQLWLIALDSLKDENVMSYICTPDGLAKTPQEAMAAVFGGGMLN